MALFRSGFTVAGFTLLSRIFGLLRELFVASLFGTTSVADSVNVAFKLPNLFRRIFGEGALSTVFIPIFNEKLLQSDQVAKRFAGEIFTLLLVTLVLIVALMQISMPYLMFLISPGFYEDQGKFDLTVLLCRITMPYLIFVSITALFGGILNSVSKFAAFAFSPVILSLVVISFTFLVKGRLQDSISISLSLIIAGVLQVLFMFVCLSKAGLTFPLTIKSSDKDVRKFLINMIPATISAGVGQLNLFISQSIASFIPGAVSILYYADRIYQFPLSIIGISFGTILLPELSRLYKTSDLNGANITQNKAIKIGLFLSIPSAIGIILLSQPIIHIIYERGAFTSLDTIKTANAISAFAFGLPAFILAKILTPIFYANQDTKTPLKITVHTLVANIVLNVILMIPFSHVGIALGTSIAAWYNVFLLFNYANKQKKLKLHKSLKSFGIKILLSCFVMSIVIFIIRDYYEIYFYSKNLFVKALTLGFTVTCASGAFFGTSLYFKLHKSLLS